MRHQMWMNDRIDEQQAHLTRMQYQNVSPFPIISWYVISAIFTGVVLFF